MRDAMDCEKTLKRKAAPYLIVALVGFSTAIGVMLAKDSNPAVAYHEWQMERAARRAYRKPTSHPGGLQSFDVDQAFAAFDHHLDRLVELGAMARYMYVFSEVMAPTSESRTIIKFLVSGQAPPRVALDSPQPRTKEPLQVTVWCRPGDVAAWRAFLPAHDQAQPASVK
jgi:hypothetical protein